MWSGNTLNYFSHYYFDHIRDRDIHNAGLILPDLVRNFVRGKKLSPAMLVATDEPTEWLKTGTEKHFDRDKKFHASGYFETHAAKLTSIIKPAFEQAGIPRYWFAAHVLTEMMIDRVLIKEAEEMAMQFYADMESADREVMHRFLSHAGLEDTSPFFERLTRFNQAKYLLQYRHDKAMVYSLNRIFMLTGADGEWTESQFHTLQEVMPEAEFLIFESIPDLKQQMA